MLRVPVEQLQEFRSIFGRWQHCLDDMACTGILPLVQTGYSTRSNMEFGFACSNLQQRRELFIDCMKKFCDIYVEYPEIVGER